MIKKYAGIIVAVLLILAGFAGMLFAQPQISTEKIPPAVAPEVRQQIEKMYSEDTQERMEAIIALEKMGKEAIPAIPFLVEELSDDAVLSVDNQMISPSKKAGEVLFKIGQPAIGPLIAAIKSSGSDAREEAVAILVKMGKSATKPLLVALEDKSDAYFSAYVIEALGKIKDPEAIYPLMKILLHDKDELSRRRAAEALLNIRSPRTLDAFILTLKDRDAVVRQYAVEALGSINDARAVEPLIVALNDKDWGVRENAAEALGNIKDPEAVEPLIAALKDEDATVRKNAVKALGNINDLRGNDALIEALKKDPDVLSEAAGVVAHLKDPRAVPVLVSLLTGPSSYASGCAENALINIGQAAVKPLAELMQENKSNLREKAAGILVKIGKPATKAFIACLRNKDAAMRKIAAESLGKIKNPAAAEALISALDDEYWSVRYDATVALTNLNDRRAIGPLITALEKEDEFIVQDAIASALWKLTAENFGNEPSVWQRWWQENKERFIKKE